MGLYSILVRPVVRRMDIESASKIALRYFEFVEKIPGGRLISRWIHNNRPVGLQREVFGLDFYNPVGLGAGLDIHGELYNDLNNLGFSFSEIGPMGADGVRRAVRRIQDDPQADILAACINNDFLTAFTLAYDFCDFFVMDFSSTPFSSDTVDPILEARLAEEIYKPIVIKLPKAISNTEIEEIADYSLMNGIDGMEARDIDQVRLIASYTRGKLPIIANTHIESPKQAEEALQAGASLIEVRNGLVRQGPQFVGNILKHLLNIFKNERTGPTPDRSAVDSLRPDA
ncbi:MAG: hypothetical protein IJU34_02110 [Bacteroidales bacterium]|nr:hypothetical protein [Bacteroidales bacterium]